MRLPLRRPSMPLAVIVLAAATGFLGYSLGPSQLANATSVSGPVSTVPGTPATPLNLDTSGVTGGPFTELVRPTTAKIDLTSLTVAADESQNEGGHIRVFLLIIETPLRTKPGNCSAAATSDSEIQIFDLQSGTTATLSPSSPIVMAPPSGKDECIDFGAEADTGSSTGQVHVSATGFVASGTYTGPHGTGSGGPRLGLLR
jgi:hypothetical protein